MNTLARLLPRTLFGRHLLLISLLILIAVVGIVVLFRQMAQEPLKMQRAIMIAEQAHAMHAALTFAAPDKRQAAIEQIERDTGTLIVQGRVPDGMTEPSGRQAHELVMALRRRLVGYEVEWQEHPERRVWLHTDIAGTHYWFGFDAHRVGANSVTLMLAVAIMAVLTALLGAGLLRYVVNRPLQSIAESARNIVAKLGKANIEPIHLPNAPHEIAQLAAALNQMVRDLRMADEERTLMLAGVSHDLRTPLSKLRLIAEIIEPHTEKELIETMKRSLAAADLVIDQFIDFSRTGVDEATQLCDVNELVLGAVRGAGSPHIHLDLGVPPHLLCRPLAVYRAVTNLLENALCYAINPGADHLPAASITVSTSCSGEFIDITIADHGPGLPEAELDRLRRPFTRLVSSRSGTPGSGLGLAIVDKITAMHNGEFILRNRPDGGLEAVLRFPHTSAMVRALES